MKVDLNKERKGNSNSPEAIQCLLEFFQSLNEKKGDQCLVHRLQKESKDQKETLNTQKESERPKPIVIITTTNEKSHFSLIENNTIL